MTDDAFGPDWWERRYQGPGAGHGSASPHLMAAATGLPIGTALDAGCGRGADAVWLAEQGWRVTAVDVAPTAVRDAEELAATRGPDVAARISWVVADLTTWEPAERFDLVVSQYVHPAAPFGEFVGRLARAVANGGTLLVVGHDHADPHSAAHAPEPASIGPDGVVRALDPQRWDVTVAESRTRHVGPGSAEMAVHDVVVKARRKPARCTTEACA